MRNAIKVNTIEEIDSLMPYLTDYKYLGNLEVSKEPIIKLLKKTKRPVFVICIEDFNYYSRNSVMVEKLIACIGSEEMEIYCKNYPYNYHICSIDEFIKLKEHERKGLNPINEHLIIEL